MEESEIKHEDPSEPSGPSYLFRADDNYREGSSIGFELDSDAAQKADIQNPWTHVLDKEEGQTSRYVSFSNAIRLREGGGAHKFTKKGRILKVAWRAVQELGTSGKIRISTPLQVA